MSERFEVRWEGELPASPREVWDAFTVHTAGWCWKISYEPWAGGAEQGLTSGGTVSVWDPPRHFTTRSADGSNELDYVLEPSAAGAFLRFRHRGETAENHERELDACQRHTAFYYHSLGEYLRHFSGRDATYVSAEAPESSAKGGFAALRRELGLPGDLTVGDRVRLRPAGLEPIDGVVDYVTSAFLGVRGDDALYRFYGRDVWGWPVGVAHHLFAAGADEAHHTRAWSAWLDGVFATEAG